MKTLLIMTVGQTDVQVVRDGKKCEVPKELTGEFHDKLEREPSQWHVVDAPSERGEKISSLPEVNWQLCTPKFDAVIDWSGWGEHKPNQVLFVETNRKAIKEDPRFAGGVLARRANDKGISRVQRCAYLGPDDRRLEDRDTPIDSIIRREVVKRIENAIREAVVDASRVVVAASGGMPEVKALVRSIAELYSPADVEFIEVDDGARDGEPDRAVPRKRVDPVEFFRQRRNALSLIEQGNFLAAWGAVTHLHGEPGQEWTQIVKWLSQFASSLPFDPPLSTGCSFDILSDNRMAVRAALHVELALRAGDIPRAVHGTVAFFEAALWDKLGERIERSSDPQKRRFFKIKSGNAPTGDKLLRKGDGLKEDRQRPFEWKERVDGVDWYWVYDGDGGPGARLAKYFLQCNALTQFDAALTKYKIRELRNDVAHNVPTPDLMKEARARMQDAKLWSSTDPPTFLAQPLVKDVLTELGVPHPERLCNDLLATVRNRLLAVG